MTPPTERGSPQLMPEFPQALNGGNTGLMAMTKTKDALKILERVTGNNETIKTGIAHTKINLDVAQMIYDARTRARLSQSVLARSLAQSSR